MFLETLPKELLLIVVEFLSPRDVESLAMVFNRRITSTCLSQLAQLFQRRRNRKRICDRFGDPIIIPQRREGLSNYRLQLGLSKYDELVASIEDETISFPTFEFLDLGEDIINWLCPLDDALVQDIEEIDIDFDEDNMRHFNMTRRRAQRVNIKIPQAFIQHLKNDNLRGLVPAITGYSLVIGDLLECPNAIDGGAGGYLLSIYENRETQENYALYMEPGDDGTHCVVALDFDPKAGWIGDGSEESPLVPQDEQDEAKELGMNIAKIEKRHLVIIAPSMDEWLAQLYYERWLWYVISDISMAREPLKDYVRENYVRHNKVC